MKTSQTFLLSSFAGMFLLGTVAPCSAQALSGYTMGSPLDRRPIVPVTAYSSSTWVPGTHATEADQIFMTSINYPGIYGAYSYADGARQLNREPFFYAHRDPRWDIPAITITSGPFRTLATPEGAATMSAGPPSVTRINRSLTTEVPPAPPERTITTSPVPRYPRSTTLADNTAEIVVRLPAQGVLEFNDTLVPGTGDVRKNRTPPLLPNQIYHYDIRASWLENGHEVVQDRHVSFHAGDRVEVDFFAPPPERKLETGPLPPVPTAPKLRPTLVPRGG
jgi:uncharacterized protein (TIGR03000 family)